MAKPRTCRSLRHNPLPSRENKLIRDPPGPFTKDSNTLIPPLAVFWVQTPTLAPPPNSAPSSTKELCQQLLKIYVATVKLLE